VKKTHLAACPACARHVRVDEPACPFCRAVLPSSFRDRRAPTPPAKRLSRAALYAFGVGTLSVSTACGGAIGGVGGKDSGQGDAPSVGEGGEDGASSGGIDEGGEDVGIGSSSGGIAVPYGLPPIELPDAEAADAGPTDASSRPDVIHWPPPPPYGGPPPIGG
jgi:hypothetical protein